MEPNAAPEFFSNPANLWLAGGVALMLLEAFGMPGVGLLFAGIGAVATGALMHGGQIGMEDHILQFTCFFAISAVSAVVLWKPLKMGRTRQKGGYSNVVGEVAVVAAGGVSRKSGGNVTWSGTVMRAELCPRCTTELVEEGTQVVIVDVRGATLVVREKA